MDTDEQWRYVDGGEFENLLKADADAAIQLWTFAEPDDASRYLAEYHQQDCAILNGDVAMNDMDCEQGFPAMCEEAKCGVAQTDCCEADACDEHLLCVDGKC